MTSEDSRKDADGKNPAGSKSLGLSNDYEESIVLYNTANKLRKSNQLIQAKYKGTILEQKVVYMALYAIQNREAIKQSNGNYVVTFGANELKRLTGYNGGSFYKQLKPIAQSLMERVYGIDDPENERFAFIHLIERCKYENGNFFIEFSEESKELLLSQNSKIPYTSLLNILNFKNIYSFRLFEFLQSKSFYPKNIKEEERNGIFIVNASVSELKLILGVVDSNAKEVRNVLQCDNPDLDLAVSRARDSMYTEYKDFKRYIIQKAVDEINSSTKIHVEFEGKRSGRAVHDIQFIVDKNYGRRSSSKDAGTAEAYDRAGETIDIELLGEALAIFGKEFSEKDVAAFCGEAKNDIELLKKAFADYTEYKNSAKKKIENKAGVVIDIIRKGGYSKDAVPVRKEEKHGIERGEDLDSFVVNMVCKSIDKKEQKSKDLNSWLSNVSGNSVDENEYTEAGDSETEREERPVPAGKESDEQVPKTGNETIEKQHENREDVLLTDGESDAEMVIETVREDRTEQLTKMALIIKEADMAMKDYEVGPVELIRIVAAAENDIQKIKKAVETYKAIGGQKEGAADFIINMLNMSKTIN